MPGQRLLERGPGSLEVAVQAGEVGAASRSRRQRPRTPERPALFFQLPGERPREIDLAEVGQGLDLVGEEPHHARFSEAGHGRHLGQAAQVGVCGLGIVERYLDEPEDGEHHGPDRDVSGAVAQGQRLARELAGLLHLAPVGADEGQGVQRGGSHGALAALVGDPARLQRVFLGGVPVPGPALELAEVVEQEGQRCLVSAFDAVPVLVGQPGPGLVEPVAPLQEESPGQGRIEPRQAGQSSGARRCVERLGPVQQVQSVRRGPGGTRRRRPGRASARSGAGRPRARPTGATPSPGGRQRGSRRPRTGRTRVPARRARTGPGHLAPAAAAWRNVCSASGQPLWW